MADKEIIIAVKAETEAAKQRLDELQKQMQAMGGEDGSAQQSELPEPNTGAWRELDEVIGSIRQTLYNLARTIGETEDAVRHRYDLETSRIEELKAELENLKAAYEAITRTHEDTQAKGWWQRLREAIGFSGKAANESKASFEAAARTVNDAFAASIDELKRKLGETGASVYRLRDAVEGAGKSADGTFASNVKAVQRVTRAQDEMGASGVRACTSLRGAVGNFIKSLFAGKLAVQELGVALKGLAYSTVVLGAIQLAYDGLMLVWDKLKALFEDTGDEAEKAGKRMEEATNNAKKAAEDTAKALERLNDALKSEAQKQFDEQLQKAADEHQKKLEEARKLQKQYAAETRREYAERQKDETSRINLEKIELQRKLADKEISEKEYKQRLLDLDEAAAENQEKWAAKDAESRRREAADLHKMALQETLDARKEVASAQAALDTIARPAELDAAKAALAEAQAIAAQAEEALKNTKTTADEREKLSALTAARERVEDSRRAVEFYEKMGDYGKALSELKAAKARLATAERKEASATEDLEKAVAVLNDQGRNREAANELLRKKAEIAAKRELEAAEAKADAAKDAEKAGREAAKQQAEYNRAISKELSDITRHYKLTGKYGEEDRRTEKDIRDCDRTALEAKQKELKDLLGRTSDAETRARIQEALEDTEKAQRALAEATEKAAKKASIDLADKKMPEFHSKDKMLNRSLQNLSKSYARYAAKAEKAAREGDTEAAAKYQKRMNNMADRMGRLDEADKKVAKRRMDMYRRTGYDNREETKAEKMKREDNERLAQIAEERSKEYRHVKKAGERQKRQTDAQARQANQPGQVPAADPKAAQEAIQGQQAALNEANTQLGQLIQAAGNVAGGAENIAAACREAIKAMNARQKNLEKELELIRKEVNA